MNFFKSKWLSPEVIFLIILLACGVLYNYHEIAFYKPVGIHQWRNSVCAAFPVNYYYGANFFTPQTNSLLADGFTSDVSVVEFPWIYYIVSLFYRVFGIHVFWFRIVQVAIGFTGLIYLFKACHFFTRDWFYAGVIPLFIFTSPIYVYYLNNFIPDAAALSINFAGFYYFLKYRSQREFRPWLAAMILFLLAGLTKSSAILPFLGLGGVALLDLLLLNKQGRKNSYFRFSYKYITSYFLVLALIFGWYLYARFYSDAHGGTISRIEIRPFWKLDTDTRQATFEGMKIWFRNGVYHANYFLILSSAIFLLTLVWFRKANRFLSIFNVMVFIGAFSFTLLFFKDMKDHDYYQINNLFVLVTVYLTFFTILSGEFPRIYRSVWTRLFFVILLLLVFSKSHDRMRYRYSVRDSQLVDSRATQNMFDIEDYLDQIGVDRSQKVYCTPDQSINISLYYCNRKGLTDYSRFRNYPLEERVEKMKEYEIEYVILGSREPYADLENLDQILGEKIGQTGDTEIFRIETKSD